MALSFPGMCIWDKFQKSQTSLVTWMIVAILLWGGEVRAANFYYDFLWSAEDNQYLIDDMLSPDLILYENNNYIFTKTAGFDSNLTLTDTNDSDKIPLNINEIFNNGLSNRKDYIHFAPNLNTPRELFYTNYASDGSSQNTGKILIKEKTNLEFIMPVSLADEEMLGSDIHFDSNLNLFVSAPGLEGENGKVYFFDKNSSTYTSSNFVEVPSSGRTQFGGSLLSTVGNLFIGAPDENSFRGAVYIYALNETGFASSIYSQSLTDSFGGSGDLFGWDMAVYGEDLAISSLYSGPNNSGQVFLFTKEGEDMTQNGTIFSSGSQSGDEFGYDIEFDENLLFVGAPGHDLVDGLNSGAVYIYQKNDGNWNETKITAPDFSPGDRFGHSLAFNNNLLFVGAEFGDGQEVDCGSVYIFERIDAGWEFRKEIFPSKSGSNQLFSSQLKVDQNLLCVTAPGLNSDGNSSIYLFRMEDATDDWELISSIDLDFFDDQERTKSSLAFKDGTIVVGNPNHNQQTGLVSGFFNPSWQTDEKPNLHPIFSKSTPTILTVLEDGDSVHHPFQFEHPFDVEVSWSMVENNSSTSSFDLNSTTGEFFYYPETDFNGIHSFKIKASLGDSSALHFFQVQVDAVDDDPYFTEEGNILPAAEDGSEYNGFTFPVFDADGDSLLVSLVGGNLPPQMEISDNMLVGTPDVNNSSDSNYSFTVSLSDGNGGAVANHTYQLIVLPRNEAPFVSFRGDLNNSFSINLFEDFSPNDWNEILNDFIISDPEENNYTVSLLEEPNFGEVVIKESQGYFYYPPLNFYGIDKFKIRVLDGHPSNPKFTDFSIKLSIKEVNDVPILLSSLPSGTARENEFYEHKFEFLDPDIGDSVNLSFEGLPSWLVFDGNRTISGIPGRTDYTPDQVYSVKFKASDQRGGHFSEYFNLVVEPVNYPPVIDGAANQSFEITEDTTEHWRIELNASDLDTVSEQLLWEVKVAPSNGVLNLAGSGVSAEVSYLPDANFTGFDEFVISVYNEQDPLAEDTVRFTANVSNVIDPPVFLSQPYTVVLRGTPWDYKIQVFDPDPLEDLLIEITDDLPEWIDYNDTQKLLSGFPPQSAEETFPITLKVTDKNGLESVQYFTLNLVNSIELIEIQEPQIGEQVIFEDSNWSGGGLTVENVQGRKISWTVIEEPANGVFRFAELENGKIHNLEYIPDNNFFGDDSLIIQASDGYSSEFRNFNFSIKEIPDPPIIIGGYSQQEIRMEDRDQLDISINFSDGDGIDSLMYEVQEIPDWVEEDFSNFALGTIKFRGVPNQQNVGDHKLRFKIFGVDDLLEQELFIDILVEELNQPVSLFQQIDLESKKVDSLEVWMQEDEPSSWVSPKLLAEDHETNSELLVWEIIETPSYGHASIDENGSNFLYFADANFSGTDHFVLGVTDDGVKITDDGEDKIISSARTTLVPVKVIVQSSNDKPVILSEPITQWTDEYPFEYRLHVYDSDWPWQGYPRFTLVSKLPSWATWKDDGNGTGLISGQPKFWDEGKHFFSFEIKSGSDQLKHEFTLNVDVDDFPPLISKLGNPSRVDSLQLSFDEDNFDYDEWKIATSIEAFDPEGDQTVLWSIYQTPTSGAPLNLSTDKNRISEIGYIPPDHFYGTDKFVLKASEGKNDRFSLLPVEVLIKPIADPPIFIEETLPPEILTAHPGDRFEVLFEALDHDGDRMSFKTFFAGSDLPPWFGELSVDPQQGTIILGGDPPLSTDSDSNFSFTLVVSDSTGRFSTTQHTVRYEEVNFPPFIQDGDKLEIIFDENASTKNSKVFPIRATDANNDSLVWSLSSYHQPRYGDILIIQEKGLVEELRYIPKDTLPSKDSFTMMVSDGESTDFITINASFDHTKFLVTIPNQFPSLYEGQFFDFNFFVQDNYPSGNGYSVKLMQGPSWLTVNKVDLINFEIVGEVPELARGTYLLSLKITHPNGYDAQFATTELIVKKKSQSSLKLLGPNELFLPVGTDLNMFSEPGVLATNDLGENLSFEQVSVTFPESVEVGKNVITYQYDEFVEERIIWGVASSPFSGISSEISLHEDSLVAGGGTPFAEYIIEPSEGVNYINSSYLEGFKISMLVRGEPNSSKSLFYQSAIKYSEINAFEYSNSIFYVLGQRVDENTSSLSLSNIGIDGELNWNSNFEFQGEVSELDVSTSYSGEILLSGRLVGSIFLGGEVISSSSPSSFVILVDQNGRFKDVTLFEQVIGSLSAVSHPSSSDWYLALSKVDENSNPITKIVCLDGSLNIISEQTISYFSSPRICCKDSEIFVVGLRKLISDPNKNLVLLKLDPSASPLWEKNVVMSDDPNFLDIVEMNINSFGQLNLSLHFTGTCSVMGQSYFSRGEKDALLMALSSNHGEHLWVEQIGGQGDELISNQFFNESGVFGISLTTAGFNFVNDEVPSTSQNEKLFIHFRSISQIPEILTTNHFNFEVENNFLHEVSIINQPVSFGSIHGLDNWLEVVNEENDVFIEAAPSLANWLEYKDSNQSFVLRIAGENNSYRDFQLPYSFVLPHRLHSSQSVIPPLDLVENIFGNANVVKMEGNAEMSFIGGNFKGSLVFDGVSNYSSVRSAAFIYCLNNDDFSLVRDFIISSDESCNIVDLELDQNGDLYVLGNFSSKVQLLNRTLNASSGTDIFLVKIGSDGALKDFVSFPIVNDQKATSLAIGDDKIFMAGSFTGGFALGKHDIQSLGKSDGFLTQLDPSNLSEIVWISSMGGTGYDYCKDIDWAKDSIVISGDYSSDMNLSGVSISLSEEYGSFCAKYSTNGSLLNYYTLESDGSLSAEKICYDKSDDSFLLMGAFSKELNTKDSFLSSSNKEIFGAKFDNSFKSSRLFKFNGVGDKTFSDLHITDEGHAYIAGSFSGSLELSKENFTVKNRTNAFLAKLDTSTFSVVDHFTLQSKEIDQISAVLNFTGNQLLLSGKSHAEELKSRLSFSVNDPFLISLRYSNDLQIGGEFTDIHPVAVGVPFKFDFRTYGWAKLGEDFTIEIVHLPSWASVIIDDAGNGYLSGYAPDKEGFYPIEFKVSLANSSSISLTANIVVINDPATPTLILPRKVKIKQFEDFEVPIHVENIENERLRMTSNLPSWIEIISVDSNKYLIRGRPEGNVLGEQVFKLTVSTLSGLRDHALITFDIERNTQPSLEQEVENLNTWSTSWIGPAYFLENGWAYHANLGWIYVQPDQFNAAWIWTKKWNWLWMNDQFWDGAEGNLFSRNLDQWIFIRSDKTNNRNLVYNYQVGKWYPF